MTLVLFMAVAGSSALAQGQPVTIWSHDDLSGGVTTISFSPDGRFIAYAASSDDRIRIRRTADGFLVRTLTTETITSAGVDELAFAPVGLSLAATWNQTMQSGGYTFFFGGLEIWSTGTPPYTGTGTHSNYTTCLAWSPDGTAIASGSTDRHVKLWDAETGAELADFYHGAWIQSVAFSPDGRYIASGAADNAVKLWDVSDGSLVRTLTGHTDYVRTLAFSPDGSLLASGAGGFNVPDNSIKLWNVDDGTLVRTLTGHFDWVLAVDFALGGKVLGSASRDGSIKFWRVADGSVLVDYYLGGAIPMSLVVAPSGKRFAYGLNNGTVVLARP